MAAVCKRKRSRSKKRAAPKNLCGKKARSRSRRRGNSRSTSRSRSRSNRRSKCGKSRSRSRRSRSRKGKKSGCTPNKSIHDRKQLSPLLASVVGMKKARRAQVVKKMWQIIKKNKLQDKCDRRYFKTNGCPKLKKLFGCRERVKGFTMMKYLKKHMC